jgi:hypothetical protein
MVYIKLNQFQMQLILFENSLLLPCIIVVGRGSWQLIRRIIDHCKINLKGSQNSGQRKVCARGTKNS